MKNGVISTEECYQSFGDGSEIFRWSFDKESAKCCSVGVDDK